MEAKEGFSDFKLSLVAIILKPQKGVVWPAKSLLSQHCFQMLQAAVFRHLAAKEPDITCRSWWRPKTELKEEFIFDLHISR